MLVQAPQLTASYTTDNVPHTGLVVHYRPAGLAPGGMSLSKSFSDFSTAVREAGVDRFADGEVNAHGSPLYRSSPSRRSLGLGGTTGRPPMPGRTHRASYTLHSDSEVAGSSGSGGDGGDGADSALPSVVSPVGGSGSGSGVGEVVDEASLQLHLADHGVGVIPEDEEFSDAQYGGGLYFRPEPPPSGPRLPIMLSAPLAGLGAGTVGGSVLQRSWTSVGLGSLSSSSSVSDEGVGIGQLADAGAGDAGGPSASAATSAAHAMFAVGSGGGGGGGDSDGGGDWLVGVGNDDDLGLSLDAPPSLPLPQPGLTVSTSLPVDSAPQPSSSLSAAAASALAANPLLPSPTGTALVSQCVVTIGAGGSVVSVDRRNSPSPTLSGSGRASPHPPLDGSFPPSGRTSRRSSGSVPVVVMDESGLFPTSAPVVTFGRGRGRGGVASMLYGRPNSPSRAWLPLRHMITPRLSTGDNDDLLGAFAAADALSAASTPLVTASTTTMGGGASGRATSTAPGPGQGPAVSAASVGQSVPVDPWARGARGTMTGLSTPSSTMSTPSAFPGPNGPYPGPNGPYPGPNGPYPGPNGPYPGPSGPYPGPYGPYPGPSGPYPGPSGPYPGPSGPYPGPSGPYPGPTAMSAVPSAPARPKAGVPGTAEKIGVQTVFGT